MSLQAQIALAVAAGKLSPAVPADATGPLRDLVTSCCSLHPKKRPAISTAVGVIQKARCAGGLPAASWVELPSRLSASTSFWAGGCHLANQMHRSHRAPQQEIVVMSEKQASSSGGLMKYIWG